MRLPIIFCICIALVALSIGCHNKPTGPQPPSDTWSLVLRPPAVMYRDASGHVPNDTILVRFLNNGIPTGGVLVHCQSRVSPDSVTPVLTTVADTVAHFTGATPTLIYWGSGSADSTVNEVVDCWCLPSGTDTVRGTAQFRVLNTP